MGFGKDIADGMNALGASDNTSACASIEIEVVQTAWSNCWDGSGPTIGAALEDGSLDACTTYTHTKGIRNDFLDFSGGILDVNKAAGLITLLDEDGNPKVCGKSDLDGITVVDVSGWAPTADTIAFVMNKCTDSTYSNNYTMVSAEETDDLGPNDVAMKMLRDGEADAIFIYADQAKNYQCKDGVEATWDCTLWEGFGTEFAYVQTGQFGYTFNGTTLAITKKDSGVAEALNPCLWEFMETEAYYDACVKSDFVDSCYPNSYFPSSGDVKVHEYNKDTDEHTGDCSHGYCPCPSVNTTCPYAAAVSTVTVTVTVTEAEDAVMTSGAVTITLSSLMALPILKNLLF